VSAPGEWLAPVMFVTVLVMIFSGYPVAFSLGGTALIFAGIAVGLGYFDWHLMLALPERVFGFMSNYVCWLCRSSSSWAPCWRSAGWPRIC
jgi:TRAP-type mannitol/chloroaromatic compound transport system permease large subunit